MNDVPTTFAPRAAFGDRRQGIDPRPFIIGAVWLGVMTVFAGVTYISLLYLMRLFTWIAARFYSSPSTYGFRRVAGAVRVLGLDIDGRVFWGLFWIPIFAAAFTYVVMMYRRDRQSINLFWSIFLSVCRLTIYMLLGIAFLLPSKQHWEVTEKRSRVVVLLDISPSMNISDDLPSASRPTDRLESRMEKVIRFLSDEQVAFLHKLLEKNPVNVYRFGNRIDEEFVAVEQGETPWKGDEWRKFIAMDLKQWVLQGLSDGGRKTLLDHPEFEGDKPGNPDWALQWLRKDESTVIPAVSAQSGFTAVDADKVRENRGKLEKRLEVVRQLTQGTNVAESVNAALNREAANWLQGLIVISDGRSTQASQSTIDELRKRAKSENVPIFTVVVGDDRQPISIQIVDVQTPEQAPPDERFVIRAEIDGTGLGGKEKQVYLDIYRPDDNPKKDKPFHTLDAKITFDPKTEPPHAQIEFPIDPTATEAKDKLPPDFFKPIKKPDPNKKPDPKDPAKKDDDAKFSDGKPELHEGEWKFVVRIPRDEGEAFLGKEHLSDVVTVQVIKKPLRVLLFASAATRDFQFVRTMLVREKDQKRAELSIFVQNLGRDGRDVQDVEPERRLARFPNTLLIGEAATKLDPKEKYYNLDQYDVIIAFDPDWNELEPEQYRLLKTWVERQAGGLIIVGGPIHTFQLARAAEGDKLRALAELFPVMPGDSVLPIGAGGVAVRRNTKKAWYLNFPKANKDMEFLKLDEDKDIPLAGWDDYFFRKEKRDERDTDAYRGFYNYYPVQSVKKGATVVATFADPAGKMESPWDKEDPHGAEPPWLVTMEYPAGRVIWLGSGELYRLIRYKGVFFERFWIKLARYASAGTRVRQNKRGVLVIGKQFSANSYVRMEAQLFGPDSQALPPNTDVKGFIAPLTSEDPKDRKEIRLSAKGGIKDLSNDEDRRKWNGWFQGRQLVLNPGEYRVEIPVPGTPDSLRAKFLVKEINPELDNTRPDFAAMFQIASEFSEIEQRLDKGTADELRTLLIGRRVKTEKKDSLPDPMAPPSADKPVEPETRPEAPRLYFDLRTANRIPDCMVTPPPKVQRSRGLADDLWDYGPAIGRDSGNNLKFRWSTSPRIDSPPHWLLLPWALFAAVGLFSVEWLTRKLLRLA